MIGTQNSGPTELQAVSHAMVKLHKEQFGRGPTNARSNYAGPDTIVCVLEEALLPAERHMVEMGEHQRVRETRMWFQVATSSQFVDAVEEITSREVRAFSSAVDPHAQVVFEIFHFTPVAPAGDGNGAATIERAVGDRQPTAR